MQPFPEHIPDPISQATRKDDPEKDKPKWKGTTIPKERPTPSVTTNFKNLRSEFPAVFRASNF